MTPRLPTFLIVSVAVGLLCSQPAQAFDCPNRSTADEISTKLEEALTAYADLDVDTFSFALDEAALMLPCLSEALDPSLSAQYHRILGLRLYVSREKERAVMAFSASRSIEPDYQFPTTLIPEGHPVRKDYESLNLDTGTFTTQGTPANGTLLFDGTQTTQRPSSWATIVQLVDTEDIATTSRYLFPNDAMPQYEVQPDAPKARPNGKKVAFLTGSIASAIGSGVVYGIAARTEQDYYSAQYDDDDVQLDSLRTQTNNLVYASVGLGTLAVAGGVGAALVAVW